MAYGKRRASGQVSGDEIVVEAAWLYYHDGLNQNEIADRLDVSRATVVNYLQEAREKNYIRLTMAPDVFLGHKAINWPGPRQRSALSRFYPLWMRRWMPCTKGQVPLVRLRAVARNRCRTVYGKA